LGQAAVQPIPTNEDLQMDVHILENELAAFAEKEEEPFMLIATAGTTGQGTLDDLQTIGAIARKYNLWYHVDGAYGGASILSRRLKDQLKGIEQADSITFDAHKWMSVPMGAGIFITAHPTILGQTFSINTEYMPKEASEMDIVDPYTHSIQWSRRFIGLKVYMSLLFFGWEGYEKVIDHQTRMGDLLREKLKANGWTIKNNTVLPVICFTDQDYESDPHFTKVILANILAKGRSWISMYPVKGVSTFRACITNYATTETELDELVADLNAERDGYVRKG
jgi:glutamate/tyrosine decarboxylase-like PLP-dependent enzyme